MYPRASYILYSTQRSGSTLLCEALRNTQVAGKPAEYFMPAAAQIFTEKWGVVLRNGLDDLGEAYFQGAYTTATPNGVFGTKILWSEFSYLLQQLGKLAPGNETLPIPQLLLSVFPYCQAIMTTRRDKVRQAISWWKAFETDQWHDGIRDKRKARRKPIFRFEAIECLRQNLVDHEQQMLKFFSVYNIQPFIVVYEDFVDNYEETALQILDYLHIPAPDNLAFRERTMQKLSDEQTEEWVQRYYQMKYAQEKLLI